MHFYLRPSSYASDPDTYHIKYKDEDDVKFERFKRNIVVLNVNSFEISALVRQIAEFTPESVTVNVQMVSKQTLIEFLIMSNLTFFHLFSYF